MIDRLVAKDHERGLRLIGVCLENILFYEAGARPQAVGSTRSAAAKTQPGPSWPTAGAGSKPLL